jgi:hypothetical protein
MSEIFNAGIVHTGSVTVTGAIGQPGRRPSSRTAAQQVRHARATLARLITTTDEQLNRDDRDRQYLIEELLADLTDLVNDLDHPSV